MEIPNAGQIDPQAIQTYAYIRFMLFSGQLKLEELGIEDKEGEEKLYALVGRPEDENDELYSNEALQIMGGATHAWYHDYLEFLKEKYQGKGVTGAINVKNVFEEVGLPLFAPIYLTYLMDNVFNYSDAARVDEKVNPADHIEDLTTSFIIGFEAGRYAQSRTDNS